MRMTLTELLMFYVMGIVGFVFGFIVSRMLHFSEHVAIVLSLISGGAVILFLSALIYQRFHWLPLWVPVCPYCRRRPKEYHIVAGEWPAFILECGTCELPLKVWMCRASRVSDYDGGLPSLCLRWPEFVGLWKRIPSTKKNYERNTV